MPRNAAGVYTLPNPPVVPDTTITSPDENGTRNDIAVELTNSLDRNGRGGMLAPFKIADGDVTTPGLAFLNDPNCGLYRIGADDIAISVGGVKVIEFIPTTVTFPVTLAFTVVGPTAGITAAGLNACPVGATTPASGAFTSGSFAGNVTLNGSLLITQVISSTASGAVLSRLGASTVFHYIQLTNTSGEGLFGIEGASGSTLVTGSSAYDTAIRCPVAGGIAIGSTGAMWMRVTAAGITAAIGAVTPATGAFTSITSNRVGAGSLSGLLINSAAPSIALRNNAGAVDGKTWDLFVNGAVLQGRTVSDNDGSVGIWLNVPRVGLGVGAISLANLNSTPIGATTPSTGVFTTTRVATSAVVVSAAEVLSVLGVAGIATTVAATACLGLFNTAAAGDNRLEEFYTDSGNLRGNIDYNRGGGVIRYNTSSDETMKIIHGPADAQISIDILHATKLVNYSWKERPGKDQIGVIAQQVWASGFKGAVSVGGFQKIDGEEKYVPWSVDKTAWMFHLIAGWQDHDARIAALEAR